MKYMAHPIPGKGRVLLSRVAEAVVFLATVAVLGYAFLFYAVPE